MTGKFWALLHCKQPVVIQTEKNEPKLIFWRAVDTLLRKWVYNCILENSWYSVKKMSLSLYSGKQLILYFAFGLGSFYLSLLFLKFHCFFCVGQVSRQTERSENGSVDNRLTWETIYTCNSHTELFKTKFCIQVPCISICPMESFFLHTIILIIIVHAYMGIA